MDEFKTLRVTLGNCEPPINESQGGSVPNTDWRPIDPYCVTAGGDNTGKQGFRNLQLYNTNTGQGMAVTKPNVSNDPDYVAPSDNNSACPAPPSLTVTPAVIRVGGGAGTFQIQITTDTSWNLSAGSFLTPSATSGTGNATVTITVAENPNETSRQAIITVYRPTGSPKTVTVTQEAAEAEYLEVSISSINVGASGSSFTFDISSNVMWSITDDRPWITYTPDEGSGDAQITVNIAENTGGIRGGTITVDGDGAPDKNISVTQQAIPTHIITLYGRGTTIDQFSGAVNPDEAMNNTIQKTIYSTSPVDQIGVGTVFYMDSQMLTPVPGEAMWYRLGNTTTAIQIDLGGYYLDMVDTGITLEISPQSSNVGAGGGTRVINISSNTDWNNYAKPAWITNVSPSLGTGNQSVTITIAQNDAQTPRTGNVSFRTGNQQRTAVFQVQQQGYSPISPTNVSIPKSGGFFSITITTAGAWSVQTPLPSEISIPSGQLSGSGDALISVSVDPNPFNNDRLITIVLMVGGVNHFVDIQQAGTDV